MIMREGIILQLQAEALDGSVDIETLLRKAYLVARKLELKEFEEWISYEQDGYKKSPPDYRIIGGRIKAWNPYHGWIPVVMQGEVDELLSTTPIYHSISFIVDTYNNSEGSITFAVSGKLTEFLNNNINSMPTNYGFHTSKAELGKIISAVRNKILDWSLLLEKNGIIGEGLTFSEAEVRTAQESSVIYNYTNNFYSTTTNTQIQQGGNENHQ